MTTVIPGVSAGRIEGDDSGDRLTESGAREVNTWIAEQMAKAFPAHAWDVIPDGPASGEWNRLVAGNNYAEPTEEEWGYFATLSADLYSCVSEEGWEPAYAPTLAEVAERAEKARAWEAERDDAICEAVRQGASLRVVAESAGISHEQVRRIVQR